MSKKRRQFTSEAFTARLEAADIAISWNGRGRYFDNIFIERLWRSVKYEAVYLNDYDSMNTARRRVRDYFNFYHRKRSHQSLDYRTPYEVYFHSLQALNTDQHLSDFYYLNILIGCLKDGGNLNCWFYLLV